MLSENNQTLKTVCPCDSASTEALEDESPKLGPVQRSEIKVKKGMAASLGDSQAL